MQTKLFKISLILLVVLGIGNSSSGQQVTGYWLDVVAKHDGPCDDGYDLTGYTTYDLYLVTEDCEVNINTIGGYGDCTDPTDISIWFDFPGNLFQHPNGGPTAYAFLGPQPGCENFDSYITVGQEWFGDGSNNSFYTNEVCPDTQLADVFEGSGGPFGGGDIEWVQGWWGFFGTDPDATLAQPIGCTDLCGVKIMRFTVNGDMSLFDFSCQVQGPGFLNIFVSIL